MQFYPNFALFSILGKMKLDQDFFQVSKLSEDQINRSSPEMEHFFPQIQVQTCAQMYFGVKLLEGMQIKTILKLLGGIQSNYCGGYILPSAPKFGTPARGSKLIDVGAYCPLCKVCVTFAVQFEHVTGSEKF